MARRRMRQNIAEEAWNGMRLAAVADPTSRTRLSDLFHYENYGVSSGIGRVLRWMVLSCYRLCLTVSSLCLSHLRPGRDMPSDSCAFWCRTIEPECEHRQAVENWFNWRRMFCICETYFSHTYTFLTDGILTTCFPVISLILLFRWLSPCHSRDLQVVVSESRSFSMSLSLPFLT